MYILLHTHTHTTTTTTTTTTTKLEEYLEKLGHFFGIIEENF